MPICGNSGFLEVAVIYLVVALPPLHKTKNTDSRVNVRRSDQCVSSADWTGLGGSEDLYIHTPNLLTHTFRRRFNKTEHKKHNTTFHLEHHSHYYEIDVCLSIILFPYLGEDRWIIVCSAMQYYPLRWFFPIVYVAPITCPSQTPPSVWSAGSDGRCEASNCSAPNLCEGLYNTNVSSSSQAGYSVRRLHSAHTSTARCGFNMNTSV